jgi:RNA polymerase sigma-70 factor (ECF subfamily)
VIELAPVAVLDEDVDLLRRAAQGEWECIGALYGRHRDSALAVATSVLADPVDAEDVVHDVFMDLPRMARTYDPRRGRPEQWLCRSVRNRAIDHVRRRSRRLSRVAPSIDGPESLLALVPSRAASPVEEVEAREFLDLVGRLDARHAHLVRLAFVDGWSHSAIAKLTGIPLGTVKTRLRNSMRQIREMLGDPNPSASAGRPSTTLPVGPVIVTVTDDPRFAAQVARSARRLAPARHLSPDALIATLDEGAPASPAAVVLDLVADDPQHARILERLARRDLSAVPLLVRQRDASAPELPARPGPVLVVGTDDAPRIDLGDGVAVALSASTDPGQRARSVARLRRSRLAFVAGDRLGRISVLTDRAAALLGRPSRQLQGAFVTDLGAMPSARSERQWQELVSTGHWTGRSVVRHPTLGPVAVSARAWMLPGGGFAAVIAQDGEPVESAA